MHGAETGHHSGAPLVKRLQLAKKLQNTGS